MANIQGVYIADGFADDCDEVMHRCLQEKTLTYEAFAGIWKDMQLSCVFHGRSSGAEIAELSEEVIHIAKHYMVANTSNFEESVAGLFLVYALLNLQPFAGFASLRIVQEDVPALERIELVARRDRRHDVLYILGSVLIKGPVQYHAAIRERGMEYSLRKYLEGYSTLDKLGVRPKGVFYRQNEELDIIRELNSLGLRYQKAKAELNGSSLMDTNLNYVDVNFAKELDSSLKNIISGIIDEDENAEASGNDSDNIDAIKSIKERAMRAKVNPIRHLVGVGSRNEKTRIKSDIKSSPGKVKTISPSKITTGSKNQPKASRKRKRRPMYTQFSSDEDIDYITKEDNLGFETDNTQDENSPDSQEDDLDLSNFNREEVEEIPPDPNEQEVDIQIDSLPCVILNEDGGKTIEIEIIDKLKTANKDEVNEAASVLQSDSSTSSIDTDKPKRADKRDLKKTILKSRFKRMGMLPVANFQTK